MSKFWETISPYITSCATILGILGGVFGIIKSWYKQQAAILTDISLLKQGQGMQAESLAEMNKKIDRINEIVHEMNGKEEGVLSVAMMNLEEMRKQDQEERKECKSEREEFMQFLYQAKIDLAQTKTALTKHERKINIISKRQERQKIYA